MYTVRTDHMADGAERFAVMGFDSEGVHVVTRTDTWGEAMREAQRLNSDHRSPVTLTSHCEGFDARAKIKAARDKRKATKRREVISAAKRFGVYALVLALVTVAWHIS